MQKKLAISMLVLITTGTTITLWADSDDRGYGEEHERGYIGRLFQRDPGSTQGAYDGDPEFATYKQECGDCHIAYPATLLPKESWKSIMGSLDKHFGDNAELDTETTRKISTFLDKHSAGSDSNRYSMRFWRSTQDVAPPMRITDTYYFRGKHHEIPLRMVKNNPQIGSFSRCNACHPRAEQGRFAEYEVRIPGIARWDD